MTEPRIRLKPFTSFNDETNGLDTLAIRLTNLVADTHEWLSADFPGVVERYRSENTALSTVRSVCRNMAESNGTFAAFAVDIEHELMGVATFQMARLKVQRAVMGFGYRRTINVGPMLALWLGDVSERPRGVLPAIIRAGAKEMAYRPMLAGRAWTLVRPSRRSTIDALSDRSNGFGGFDAIDVPQDFSYYDGVTAQRQAYMARLTTGTLAA